MGCQGSKSTSTAPASDKGESEEQKDNAIELIEKPDSSSAYGANDEKPTTSTDGNIEAPVVAPETIPEESEDESESSTSSEDSSSDEDENTSKSKKEKASEEQGEPKQSEKQDQPEPITGADELASEPKVAEVEVASDGDNKPSEGPVSTETEQAVTQENSEPLVPSAPEEVSEISQGAKESEGKENQENQEGQENQESQERKQSAVDLSAAPVEDETQPDDKPATVAENGTPDDQSAEKPAEESAQ